MHSAKVVSPEAAQLAAMDERPSCVFSNWTLRDDHLNTDWRVTCHCMSRDVLAKLLDSGNPHAMPEAREAGGPR